MHLMEGELPPSMSGSCGACINGRLYVFGGYDDKGYSNRLYFVDLRTRDGTYIWEKITKFEGQPPTPRDKLSCWVYKDRLIYFGGYGYRRHSELQECFDVHDASWEEQIFWGWHNDVHVFDTKTRTWSQPEIKQTRMNDLHYLNLDTWVWSGRISVNGESPKHRSWHTLTAIADDKLFLFGGLSADNIPLSDGWIHNIITNCWKQLRHLPYTRPRLWHTACLGKENEIMVFGGSKDNLLFLDTGHCNDLLIFQTQPYSLLRSCLDCIGKNAIILKSQISLLPPKLLQQVFQKITFWTAANYRKEQRIQKGETENKQPRSNQVRGLYDFYLPREELWIYNMETGRWKKINTEGDVPPSMSGSCAVCVDRVLYLFGGHHSRGNTNKFYMLDSRSADRVLQWERIDCQGIPPSSKDKLGVWVYKNKLIFFGGYGYLPEDKVLGTFEFDETSFWGKAPSPRAAHACATVGNKGFVFGGRYRDARMNDLHYLNLDTWEWNELIPQGICPVGRSWHSLTPVSSDHLFLFGGFTTEKQPLSDAWTYCISKNEWIQFNHPYVEKPRLWHTACASDEGEVIVFGGCANNLLVHHRAAHSNEVLIFSVQPKSLVRLSLEAVICFKEMLANSWSCLPKHLLHSVNQRFGSNNTSGS